MPSRPIGPRATEILSTSRKMMAAVCANSKCQDCGKRLDNAHNGPLDAGHVYGKSGAYGWAPDGVRRVRPARTAMSRCVRRAPRLSPGRACPEEPEFPPAVSSRVERETEGVGSTLGRPVRAALGRECCLAVAYRPSTAAQSVCTGAVSPVAEAEAEAEAAVAPLPLGEVGDAPPVCRFRTYRESNLGGEPIVSAIASG